MLAVIFSARALQLLLRRYNIASLKSKALIKDFLPSILGLMQARGGLPWHWPYYPELHLLEEHVVSLMEVLRVGLSRLAERTER